MNIESDLFKPVVEFLVKLDWQEGRVPEEWEVIGYLDMILSDEEWIGVSILPSGPKNTRKAKIKFNDYQMQFVQNYLICKVVDKYIEMHKLGPGYFYRLIRQNSKLSEGFNLRRAFNVAESVVFYKAQLLSVR